ncbi:pseudouridine synthase DEG1 [Sporobolomyces salmoneus]|uniref:pseudouridine synthase DEG1 n=1 Tax=Sporobolomyces salmoneus TaxID=183962 RepID=UPI00316C1FF1
MSFPHNPERLKLVSKISQLQKELAKLDRTDPPASVFEPPRPDSTTSLSSASVSSEPRGKAGKKARQDEIGPLPPSLANAPKRHIALLFSYEGWAHSGLAYQPKGVYTPLPTVEACILSALEKSRLIEPIVEGEGFGCGFERCGRTDAGVSSSAQVINLWVRSDLKDPMGDKGRTTSSESIRMARSRRSSISSSSSSSPPPSRPASPTSTSSSSSDLSSSDKPRRKPHSPVEIPYVTILNRHLPPSIRIHAWSPVSANFSSRFSCIWRHYKYFFSTSPDAPLVGSAKKFDFGAAYEAAGFPDAARGWQERIRGLDWGSLKLDVKLMQDAVDRLVGEHDFRNFCKVDPPKQLTSHRRTVNSATIDPVEGEDADTWVLNLRGGAFLYNQVRHIVAILFLVGAGLEPPSIVDRLLWTSDRTDTTISKNQPPSPFVDMDRKPSYQIADDLPLILWQCGFNSTELSWRTDNVPRQGDAGSRPSDLEPYMDHNGRLKLVLDPHETFRRSYLEMYETYGQYRLKSIILKHHLAALSFNSPHLRSNDASSFDLDSTEVVARPPSPGSRTVFTPLGAGSTAKTTTYIPLLQRKYGELPETLNARWAAGRGQQKMQRRIDNAEEANRVREINLKIKAEAFAEAQRLEKERQQAEGGDGSGRT